MEMISAWSLFIAIATVKYNSDSFRYEEKDFSRCTKDSSPRGQEW